MGNPIPDNDWVSMNVRFDEVDRLISSLKDIAVVKDGSTVSEFEKLNKSSQTTIVETQLIEIPSEPVVPEPIPVSIDVPANFTGLAQVKILTWEWDDVVNEDVLYYQFYASKTGSFTPDANYPADMKYRKCYGNQTSIFASGAGQTWYGKVRQVSKSGKSSFTAEVALTSS